MGKTGGEGGGANQMMYGFIFIMYAITAGVLFYVMINRQITYSIIKETYTSLIIRRERKKRRAEAEAKMSLKEQQEVIDGGVEMLKEQQKEIEGEQIQAEVTGEEKDDNDVQKTSFEEPTVEEIKQLQEQPKKLIDKKTE